MRTQRFFLPLWLTLTVLFAASFVDAVEIKNDPTKEYRLNEKHGPWMIMVGTFSDVRDPDQKKDGLSAQEAANKLVHELRAKGIPAYVYLQNGKKETIEIHDRLGNTNQRSYNASHEMVCVLAGNYNEIEDATAQKTLTFIKRFKPKFMSDPKSGAVVRDGGNAQKGPFGNAFLTINPARSPSTVVQRRADNETKYFNSGIDYALVGVKRKYTLKVATFAGKSVVPLGNSKFSGHEDSFDKAITQASFFNLGRAGEDATQLTYNLRQNKAITRTLGRDQFEAYVYHDKFQSIVTIGGFDSKDDPEIPKLAQIFMAKYQPDESGQQNLEATSLKLPGKDAYSLPVHTWAFDPVPEIIEIPRIR